MTSDTITQLTNLAALATKPIAEYAKRLEDLNRQLDDLDCAGCAEATPSYKANKYLYLIYPTAPDGSRRREYIGTDPEKQKAALARLDRHKQRAKVVSQLAALDWQLRRAMNALDQYHRILG